MLVNFSSIDQRLQELLKPLPALAIGLLLLRLPEMQLAWGGDTPLFETFLAMLINDGVAILKGIPVWCAFTLPLLLLKSERLRTWGLAVCGSLLLSGEAALIHYFEVSGVPLGADLFGYSYQEIRTTVSGTQRPWPWAVLSALILALLLLWFSLVPQLSLFRRSIPRGWSLGLLCIGLVSTPVLPTQWHSDDMAQAHRQHQKLSFFFHDVFDKLLLDRLSMNATAVSNAAYPFAHSEATPDTLGPLLNLNERVPPHVMVIVVEGLGRSFSGPGASLGSFTPFLDTLAGKSLYWENFLASQGRTFAVLPSVFGSLPFGPYGDKSLGHDSLLSILKSQSYDLRYFSGSNLEFDHQGAFLASEGVQKFISEKDFPKSAIKASEWGYADADLFVKVADELKKAYQQPTLSIVQTMSMHTPFMFPGIEAYRLKVDQRLALLNIAPEKRPAYLKHRDIYASILYTDDALRQFFDQLTAMPEWSNTIVIITGDHRLPEIPMATRLERYHVPLMLVSPMVRSPQMFKSVSSHFDIAPSLLAMLSHRYNLKTPKIVSWMGSGLDVQVPFRNVHRIPLKQTKTELSDFVSGEYYLAQDRLYRIDDGLQPEPIDNPEILAEVKGEFAAFRASLLKLDKADRLTEPQSESTQVSYVQSQRNLESQGRVQHFNGVEATQTQALIQADGNLQVTALLTHHGKATAPVVVPLLVLTDTLGQELGEVSGKAIQLQAGQTQAVSLSLKLAPSRLVNGQYFVSLVVSHPDTGKPIGQGQYHVPVQK